MAIKDELLELDRGFWLGDEAHFNAYVDDQCVLLFKQMQGVYPRADVAASAHDPKRWRDLDITNAFVHEPRGDTAFLGYEARVKRGDGMPYRALIGSTYVRRGDAWKLTVHQHSELDPEG